MVPYKRVDLAIEAFNRLGKRLVEIGNGPEINKLKKQAKSNIEFLGNYNDASLKDMYSNCKALIFPGEEDFGIVPLEVQAVGRPVIAYARGGAMETVLDEETGLFFTTQTPENLIDAVTRIEDMDFDSNKIINWAKGFDRNIFKQRIDSFIKEKYKQHSKTVHIKHP